MNLAVVGGGVPAANVTPNIYNEKFETTKPTNGGYDIAGGVEHIDASQTLDPDYASLSVSNPVPLGWGSQCLRSVITAGTKNAYLDMNVGNNAIAYGRASFWVVGHSLATSEYAAFMVIYSNDPGWKETARIYLYNDNGTLRIRMNNYYDGNPHSFYTLTGISLATRYLLEWYWDATNHKWGWRLGGVNQPNDQDATDPVTTDGILSSAHGIYTTSMLIGLSDDTNAAEICIDLVGLHSSGWIGDVSA